MPTLFASILVDFKNIRCDHCKVALHDDLGTDCPICGAVFDDIISNHVGLAQRLRAKRDEAGVKLATGAQGDPKQG